MAHSIQEYRGRSLVLSDLDIVAAVLLLRWSADEQGDGPSRMLVLRWEQALGVAGPGTIDLRLDEIGRSDEDRRCLRDGLATLRRQTESFGATIPGSVLGASPFAGVALSDYPGPLVRRLALALEDLVGGGPPA